MSPAGKPVRATVVIRALDEASEIGGVLDAVLAQEEKADVLVIDSGSRDGTQDVVRDRPGVALHQMAPGEFSFGGACNLGLSLTTTAYVVFLSAHALPLSEHWLGRLLQPFAGEEVAGTFGAQLPRPDQDPVRACGQRDAFAVDPLTGTSQATFSNANSAVRRRDWEAVPFDAGLAGGEDFAWAEAQGARDRGVVYVPDAAVTHSHLEPLSQVHRRHRREAEALVGNPAPPTVREYLRKWAYCSSRDVTWLLRARDPRWAAWAPAYYAARFLGEYQGRRDAGARR